jgi:hypothetical protein
MEMDHTIVESALVQQCKPLSVVTRFDQLMAFCAMELSLRLGAHVSQRLSRAELEDQANRLPRQGG